MMLSPAEAATQWEQLSRCNSCKERQRRKSLRCKKSKTSEINSCLMQTQRICNTLNTVNYDKAMFPCLVTVKDVTLQGLWLSPWARHWRFLRWWLGSDHQQKACRQMVRLQANTQKVCIFCRVVVGDHLFSTPAHEATNWITSTFMVQQLN